MNTSTFYESNLTLRCDQAESGSQMEDNNYDDEVDDED
jgi:hypothetical protein